MVMLLSDLHPASPVHIGEHRAEQTIQTTTTASVRGYVERELLLEVALILAAQFGAGTALVALRGRSVGLGGGHAVGARATL